MINVAAQLFALFACTAFSRPLCSALWAGFVVAALAWIPVASGSPTVGVYYYPWWGTGAGGHSFNQTLRAHTIPQAQLPAVGSYNNRNSSVISAHIDQSHQGNISMWSMSWWGPGTFEDVTIRQHILPHARSSELKYTIHYESTGRLGTFANPNYANLLPDFQHLATHVFSDPNYLRIDGRPVVFVYLTREYFKTPASWDALSQMRSTIEQQFGYDPYIIGDDFFGFRTVDPARASQFDAITAFDVYGMAFGSGNVTQSRVDFLERIYGDAKSTAETLNVGFVPTVSPGFNDKGVRAGHQPAARYLSELGPTAQGSLMTSILEDAVLPHTDPSVGDLVMVNSFNEWHEDTQIEASTISPLTNTDDSTTGMALTVGRYYEGYGGLYLDLLRDATLLNGDYDRDSDVDSHDYFAWKSSFGLTGPSLWSDGNRDGIVDAADYVLWRKAAQIGGGAPISLNAVPEPSVVTYLLCAIQVFCCWRRLPDALE